MKSNEENYRPKTRKELEQEYLSNMTRYDRKQYLKNKKIKEEARNKKIRNTFLAFLSLGVCFIIGFSVYVSTLPILTIGDKYKIDDKEFNFYYSLTATNYMSNNSQYLSYLGLDTSKPLSEQVFDSTTGKTWEDYFKEQAYSTIDEIYSVYNDGKENNWESDSLEDDIDDYIETIEETAKENEHTKDEYIKEIYGKDMDETSLRKYLSTYLYSLGYATYIKDSFDISDTDIESYYSENYKDFDKFDYLEYIVSPNYPEDATDEIKEQLDETLKTNVDTLWGTILNTSTREEFIESIYNYVEGDESSKESYKDGSAIEKKGYTLSMASPSITDWLEDSSRVTGDKNIFKDDIGSYHLVYFDNRYLDDSITKDVRHILIMPKEVTDEGGNVINDGKEEAKAKIEEIKKEFDGTSKSEDDFAKLASKYTEDTGSIDNGGLYEGVTEGEMVEEFNDWLFDSSRKEGDVDIIETTYGYHLMYFVGDNLPSYKLSIKNTLIDERYSSWYEAVKLDYTTKVQFLDKSNKEDSENIEETTSTSEVDSNNLK